MNKQVGDGASQPTAGVVSIESMASLMDAEDAAPDELIEGEEEIDLPEGEEIETQPDEDEDTPDEPTLKLKHEGKEFELKQSEVVELAQKGYDYTQKTMAVAEERKTVDAERGQVKQLRTQAEQVLQGQLHRLQALEQFFDQQLGVPPPAALAQQDVAYYIAQKEHYEARKGQLEQTRAAIAQLQDEQARTRQAWIVQKAEETEQALRNTLPGWNEKSLDELADYAGKHGIDQDVANDVLLQKGFWELAHKARAYDELMAKKAQMKPVAQLAKVAKPQTTNQPTQLAKRQDAMKRHKAAPSIKTLADLL